MLVIDAGGDCGQNADSIHTWGQLLFDHDPQKNVAFSVHMYAYWRDPGDPIVGTWDGRQPYDLDLEMNALVNTGLPLIVGEFGWQASNEVRYTTSIAMQTYENHGVGWLAWMWHGGNNLDMAHGHQYNSDADLTDYGRFVVNDPTVGLKATAVKASIFGTVPPPDGGTYPDAAVSPDASYIDSGAQLDGGVLRDAGAPTQDSGVQQDTGIPRVDGGRSSGGGGGRERGGCDCAATDPVRGNAPSIPLVGLMLFGVLRSRRSAG
jgi:uncharacterized protein (TIGR03382 family)